MTGAVHLLQDDETTIAAWLRRAEILHRTLRPALPADYEGYLQKMFSEGAHMAILHVANAPKALAVYRIHHTTLQGLRFYVDDLVTEEAARGQGFGAALLDWCEGKATAERCDTFALDAGVQRAAAHRFYFRHGLLIKSFSFSKDVG
jgi:GNAT superfamily N-acetyltransferase